MVIKLTEQLYENKASYIVICEDISKIGNDNSLLFNPFMMKRLALPIKFVFSIAMGLRVNNLTLESAEMKVFNPSLEVISELDLKELYFTNEKCLNEDGSRIDTIIGIRIEMTSDDGVLFDDEGEYYIKVFVNNIVIGETFFMIAAEIGELDE
ncbi:hypothetical protein [Paenibacillus sp. IHBB 10380]|uniref:hypothetical protein n=1 Tax=Paenibacillus sp. IHBB 10380 TaxID=1566358 RepID=UPI0005CFA980|nr:hypothetical protein [Paenibacillus sp. IHBB 10380]AJS59841.1 hypothetical protein UB51_16665 [Paenibacillus sp. IHBB 10380]